MVLPLNLTVQGLRELLLLLLRTDLLSRVAFHS
jgi:hypothetical protein